MSGRRTGFQVYEVDGELVADPSSPITGTDSGDTPGVPVKSVGSAGVPDGGTTAQVLAKASDADGDTEWVDQSGGGGGGFEAAHPVVRGLLTGPAGGRNLWPNRPINGDPSTSRSGTSVLSWVRRPIYAEVRDPYVVCVNSTTDGNGETTTGLANITVRSALLVNGALTLLTYDGQPHSTAKQIAPGALAVSDKALGLVLKTTDEVYEVTLVTGATAGQWPAVVGLSGQASGEGFIAAPSSGQITTAFSTGAGAVNGPAYAYCSSALLGTYTGGRVRSASINGDSIASTVDDIADPDKAFIVRALEARNVPYIRLSNSGDQLAHIPTSPVRLALAALCSDAIIESGVNDILDGQNLATMQARALAAEAALATAGAQRVYFSTITPTTQGGAGSQTQIANTGTRVPYNNWLRARLPAISGAAVAIGTTGAQLAGDGSRVAFDTFDVSDIAETARDSGIFKTAYYSDGVHPTSAGAAAYRAAVPTLDYPAVTSSTSVLGPGKLVYPSFGQSGDAYGGDQVGGYLSGVFVNIDTTVTVDSLIAIQEATGDAGAQALMMIFNGAGALVAATAAFDSSTGGNQSHALTAPARLTPGEYALAYGMLSTPTSFPLFRGGKGAAIQPPTTAVTPFPAAGFRAPMGSGAAPATVSFSDIVYTAPLIFAHVLRT